MLRRVVSASDSAGERLSSLEAPVCCAESDENVQGQLLLEDKRQSLSGGALGFVEERPRPPEFKSMSDPTSPMNFQHCQRPPMGDSGLSIITPENFNRIVNNALV